MKTYPLLKTIVVATAYLFVHLFSIPAGFSQTLSCGEGHTLMICSNGSVLAWGFNNYGQLGNDTTTALGPYIVNGISNPVSVCAGFNHSVALLQNGTVWAWGYNAYGQLGHSAGNESTPMQVSGLTGITKIAAGGGHTLALKNNGTVWAWGANNWGQLGNGNNNGGATPQACSNLTNVVDIAAGANFSLALKSDGTVWAWGHNADWQLGDSTGSTGINTPIQVQSINNVAKISAGRNFALALKTDSTVWAWGYDGFGTLGNDTPLLNSYTPVQVSNLTGVVAIAAGGFGHSLALKKDGTVWSWGINGAGELGTWDNVSSYVPTAVHYIDPLDSIATIAAGLEFSVAIGLAGEVWHWGRATILGAAVNYPTLLPVLCTATGMAENEEAPALTAYIVPNPATETANLLFDNPTGSTATVLLYDVSGRLIGSGTTTGSRYTLALGALEPGLYIATVKTTTTGMAKLVVK